MPGRLIDTLKITLAALSLIFGYANNKAVENNTTHNGDIIVKNDIKNDIRQYPASDPTNSTYHRDQLHTPRPGSSAAKTAEPPVGQEQAYAVEMMREIQRQHPHLPFPISPILKKLQETPNAVHERE
ncbi:hypothetical protein ABW21_db0204729 [Orbilia brochopaga]|nr:hypothetical protein ABW21_db0204729 [Drechslerella brochopaga]